MKTLDLRKTLRPLYNPPAKAPVLVDVPAMRFLMVDGAGDPNTSPAYPEAIEALYGAAYTLKFTIKRAKDVDYPVMALEGLWWARDMAAFALEDRGAWQWTMMIMQPDLVTPDLVRQAVAEAGRKKALPALARLRLERFAEGRCAQIMHVGPYSAEAPTIRRLHEFIAAQGLGLPGKHHEIYMSDPRRTAPERLKTVIRQGVA